MFLITGAPAASGPGRVVAETGDARVRLLESADAVERHGGAWEALGSGNVGADPGYLLTWCRLAREVRRPHVLVVEEGGVVTGLAAGRIEDLRRPLRLGGRSVLSPSARKLVVVHEGVLGSANDRHAELIMRAWWQALRDGEADAIVHRLGAGSPLHEAARRYDAFWQSSRMDVPLTRWRLRLPESFDALMLERSSDSRRKLRRVEKRRRAVLGDDLVVRCHRDPADHERIMRELEDISARSSQHEEGRGFVSSEHTRGMIRFGLERGFYRVWVMYAAGRPIAWCDGELYRGTFFTADGIGTTGYDASPAYRDLSLGTAVMLAMFEDLCADPEARVVDFGIGPWEYKRRWSNDAVPEVQFALYGARPRPIAMSLGRRAGASALRIAGRAQGAVARARAPRG